MSSLLARNDSAPAQGQELQSEHTLAAERQRTLELSKYFTSTSVTPGTNPPTLEAPRLPPDATLIALSQLGALKLDCNRSFISLIDGQHQYIISEATKSNSLFVPRQHAPSDDIYLGFCALELSFGVCPQTIEAFTTDGRTIESTNITANKTRYIIRDFTADSHFSTRPYVKGWPHMRSYAEVPLTSASGYVIGSYCVVDDKPRDFENASITVLEEIACTIVDHLDLLKTKLEHRRVERLVCGLGSYVNGALGLEAQQNTSTRTLHESAPEAPRSDQRVVAEAAPFSPVFRRTDSSTTSARSSSFPASPPAAMETPPESDEGSIPRHEYVARQDAPVHSSWQLDNGHSDQASVVAEGIRKTLARAGNIIRQAMDMQGVVFVDPSSRDFGDVTGIARMPEAELRASVPEAMFTRRQCHVIGGSTETESIVEDADAAAEFPSINEGLLKRMLLRYPLGHVASADRHGVLSTAKTTRGFPNGDGFAQYNLGSRTAAENSKEADDVAEIFRALPKARSVLFLPIWDFQKESWFSAVLGWTADPVRIFNVADLDYLSAFGNSIMAEVSRIEALALSRAKSDFISSISHELRSPLHGILAGAELLRESITQASESSMLNNIDACGNMLLDTMNHLLDFAKISSLTDNATAGSNAGAVQGADGTQTRSSVVDLGELIQDVVDGVALGHYAQQNPRDTAAWSDSIGRANDVVVLVDIDLSIDWRVDTEVGAWKRIVMNLFGNALKYTDQGRINVEISLSDLPNDSSSGEPLCKHICLCISDTGRGMSDDYLRHGLFKPFAQENSLSIGTGLGLSIVQRLVESLSGTIEVQSEKGVGTRIDVRVPIGKKTRLAQSGESTEHFGVKPSMHPSNSFRDRTLLLPPVLTSATSVPGAGYFGQPDEPLKDSNPAIRACLSNIARNWLGMRVLEHMPSDASDIADSPQVYTLSPRSCLESSPASHWTLRLLKLSPPGVSDEVQPPILAQKILSSPFSPRGVATAFLEIQDPESVLKPLSPSTDTQRAGVHQAAAERPPSANRAVEDSMLSDAFANSVAIISDNEANRTPSTLAEIEEYRQTHVLLVDDNNINVQVLCKVARNANCSFVTASDGLQAVNAFKDAFEGSAKPFDLIFMDLSMPVMDGCSATRQIRAFEKSTRGQSRRTHIVALTALGSDASREEAFASGVDAFLSKPVPMKEVKALLQK